MIRSNTICRFCRFYRQVRPLSRPLVPLPLEARLCEAREIKIRPADAPVQTEHLLWVFLHQLATRRAKILWKSGVRTPDQTRRSYFRSVADRAVTRSMPRSLASKTTMNSTSPSSSVTEPDGSFAVRGLSPNRKFSSRPSSPTSSAKRAYCDNGDQ